jgi:3-dehydro-L-gulonate 2-dehydrogenase
MILVSAGEMQNCFNDILLKKGFTADRAIHCATIFTDNSVDGIYTHGVNRFPRFVEYIDRGFIKPNEEISLRYRSGGLEQWNGNLGPGVLNAQQATDISTSLARQHGIGCVALSNTNHWMRGGSYGWRAAKSGFAFIGWTNTIANMPAWGAKDPRLGNNPLVIAVPYQDEAIVLDMAMSQYSFGSMEMAVMKNEKLPVPGGFDREGKLTDDPAEILALKRPVPVGFWKGAGLSLLLDLLASILSGGQSTHEISKQNGEYGLSQVFITINISDPAGQVPLARMVENIISDYHQSIPAGETSKIVYPGERVLQSRKNNLSNGIPVLEKVWKEILQLRSAS